MHGSTGAPPVATAVEPRRITTERDGTGRFQLATACFASYAPTPAGVYSYRGQDLGNLGTHSEGIRVFTSGVFVLFLAVLLEALVLDTPTHHPCETGLARVCLILNSRVA